jgi:hypothetical protein
MLRRTVRLSEVDQIWLLKEAKKGSMSVAEAVGLAKRGPEQVARFRRASMKREADADVARVHANAAAVDAEQRVKRELATAIVQAAVVRWITRRKIEVRCRVPIPGHCRRRRRRRRRRWWWWWWWWVVVVVVGSSCEQGTNASPSLDCALNSHRNTRQLWPCSHNCERCKRCARCRQC